METSRSGYDHTFIGTGAGNSNTTGNDNIYVGNWGPSSGTESNTIRIGTQGTFEGAQNVTYIAGIYGSSVGGSGIGVFVDSNGQRHRVFGYTRRS